MSPPTSVARSARQVSDLAALLRLRAETAPDDLAYRFSDGDGPAAEISYAQLLERSAALGSRLAVTGRRGDRVLLLLPPGIDYIVGLFGCLQAGRVAVPTYPADPRRPAQSRARLEAICADAEAAVALGTADALAVLAGSAVRPPHRIDIAEVADDDAGPLAGRPHEVAILHYTSGSTAAPKGIVLGHDNLLANLEHIRRAFGQTPETRGVFWLPPYHDMGLIGGILEPLYAGYPSVLLSPASFVARPMRWLEEIQRNRATTSGGPNFGYDLCVRKSTLEQRQQLDLSSWNLAFNGSEPVRADTLRRFAAAFASAGFRPTAFLPCYGLAEATLLVSCGGIEEPPRMQAIDRSALGAGRLAPGESLLVSSGRPAAGLLVAIVDPRSGSTLADGRVGEIWISGASLAHGYWRRPDDAAFDGRLPEHPGRRFLRTGDLGALVGGELFVTGRDKDVIVVRGRNVYPQDLELAAEQAHPAIRPGGTAAFPEQDEDETRIAIVCEVNTSRADAEAVGRAVRRSVADRCDVLVRSVVLVAPGGVPKTSSGKVRRRACRSALDTGALTPIGQSRTRYSPSSPPSRAAIAAATGPARLALVRELILSLAARRGALVDDGAVTLLDLFTDSLQAMELAADLDDALGVQVRLERLLGAVPLTQLAEQVAELFAQSPEQVGTAPPAVDPTALSEGQQALWLLQRLAPFSSAYHLSLALRLHGRLDADALARAVTQVAARHFLLRACVTVTDGLPRFAEVAPPELVQVEPASPEDAEALIRNLTQKPFDLERGALWRCALLDGPAPILAICMHHLIGDYASLQILLDDLERALRLGSLPALQPGHPVHRPAEPDPAYWAGELADLPVLDLPSPHPRPVRPSQLGSQHETAIPAATLDALSQLARAEGTTLHTVLLAGLHALLGRWTGQDDIAIGTPVSGRRSTEAAEIIGYYTNPLPIRAHPAAERPFVELVREVRNQVIAAVAHELPFPSIVRAAGGRRDPSRSPVFQALFALEGAAGGRGLGRPRFADSDAEPLVVRPSHVPFDLAVLAEQTELGVTAVVQVGHDALPGECAGRLAEQWLRLLEDAGRRPSAPIGELALLSAAEHRFVVHEVNRTAAPAATDCLHQLFARQARRTPHAVAIVDGDREIRYQELLERAAAIAAVLTERGIGPEQRVGVHAAREADTVAAILGVLGAGAAYVYLDPGYPGDRLGYLVRDAEIGLLLTQRALAGSAPQAPRTVVLDDIPPSATAAPADVGRPGDLAYIIYTSGSTGRPKGVAIEHRNAAALVGWAHAEYGEDLLRGVLAGTSLAFDLSVFELFAPLTCGGTVILAGSALELAQLPARDRLTLINTVPSVMAELLAAEAIPAGVRVVNLAGEPLGAALADAVLALDHVERLYNLYGPTEDTTYSTAERVRRGVRPTLGRSLPNRAAYLLDRLGHPVPVGVDGEICLGGAGVARGYVNQPELTGQRFVESRIPGVPGRLYRTGDLGRRLPDGRIEYRGRRDRQVKLRGFRIELDEVAAALLVEPAVRDAYVTVDDRQRLVAFVAAPEQVRPDALGTALQARLPPFMLPSRIIVLPRLPLTGNGKVDQRALQAAATAEAAELTERPASPAEAALAEIWREVLGVQAGPTDDFFALGGHSLLASQFQLRVRNRLGVDLPLASIFERPTIRQLAERLPTGADSRLLGPPEGAR